MSATAADDTTTKDETLALAAPAHIKPFVDVLGLDDAIQFLLKYGGGYAYFSAVPGSESEIAQVIGVERCTALAKALGAHQGTIRVPLAKPFIARVLSSRGQGPTAIARQLHVSDVSVRRWLESKARKAPAKPHKKGGGWQGWE